MLFETCCLIFFFDQLIWRAWCLMKKDRESKGGRRAMLRYGILREHNSPRTTSTVERVRIVRVWEVRTLAGMSGLVIVLDRACTCQWKRRWTLKRRFNLLVKTTARSFAASDGRKRNCLSKNKSPFVAELSMSCRKTYMTVCCNNGGVVSSDRLFRQVHVKRKTKEKDDGRPWGKKVPASSTWWHFFEVQQLLAHMALWLTSTIRMQKLNLNKFDQWRIRRRMWTNTNSVSWSTCSHTKFRREDFARSILPGRRAPF